MQHAYLELKLAWELYQKAPESLSAPERSRLSGIAVRQNGIEQAILASPESANIVVPAATLATRLAEIRQRYANDDEYAQDLERIGLNAQTLAAAVERDLRVEAALDKVAAAVGAVSEVDAEIYYRLHPDAFDRPPARRLRHILITYNDGNEKAKALKLLETLRLTATSAEKFGQAALRHSQCPTAMDGGLLGTVKPGQLYPELEPAAFALAAGEISSVQESPIGLHILRCDEIMESGLLPFAEVRARIVERLNDKRRAQAQREWVKRLLASQSQNGNSA